MLQPEAVAPSHCPPRLFGFRWAGAVLQSVVWGMVLFHRLSSSPVTQGGAAVFLARLTRVYSRTCWTVFVQRTNWQGLFVFIWCLSLLPWKMGNALFLHTAQNQLSHPEFYLQLDNTCSAQKKLFLLTSFQWNAHHCFPCLCLPFCNLQTDTYPLNQVQSIGRQRAEVCLSFWLALPLGQVPWEELLVAFG